MANTIGALPQPATTDKTNRLRQQATELEGVFLTTLVKEMFASVESESELGGGSFAETTWRDMQAEQFANVMAEAGGIGLADSLMADLLALQESAQSAPPSPLHGAHK